MNEGHVIDIKQLAGEYDICLASESSTCGHTTLRAVLAIDEYGGWSLGFRVGGGDSDQVDDTPQLSTAIRLYEERSRKQRASGGGR